MRLARLAAVGLAIGVIVGFAIALLRPRPNVRTDAPDRSAAASANAADSALRAQFKQAERDVPAPVLDLRADRRVTG